MFLSWLLWLPADADPREAAHAEIARIDTSSSSSPEVRRLRSLFETLARSDG